MLWSMKSLWVGHILKQACPTSSPQTACGPGELVMWPHKLSTLIVIFNDIFHDSTVCSWSPGCIDEYGMLCRGEQSEVLTFPLTTAAHRWIKAHMYCKLHEYIECFCSLANKTQWLPIMIFQPTYTWACLWRHMLFY